MRPLEDPTETGNYEPIAHDFWNFNTKDIIGFVYDDIDGIVEKNISPEQFLARGREVSIMCNSWKTGMTGYDSLEEQYVDHISLNIMIGVSKEDTIKELTGE